MKMALRLHPISEIDIYHKVITLMLLMSNLANTKLCKKPEKGLKPWHMVIIWDCSARAIQWIPRWQGVDGFRKIFASFCLNKNSLSIGRDNYFSLDLCVLLFYLLFIVFLGFLELINNMLTSGMVPALYPDDEKEGIIGQVRKDNGYSSWKNNKQNNRNKIVINKS